VCSNNADSEGLTFAVAAMACMFIKLIVISSMAWSSPIVEACMSIDASDPSKPYYGKESHVISTYLQCIQTNCEDGDMTFIADSVLIFTPPTAGNALPNAMNSLNEALRCTSVGLKKDSCATRLTDAQSMADVLFVKEMLAGHIQELFNMTVADICPKDCCAKQPSDAVDGVDVGEIAWPTLAPSLLVVARGQNAAVHTSNVELSNQAAMETRETPSPTALHQQAQQNDDNMTEEEHDRLQDSTITSSSFRYQTLHTVLAAVGMALCLI